MALYEIAKELKGKELDQALENFVALLFRSQKFGQAARIFAEFEKLVEKQDGLVRIEITSARELENASINHIEKMFGNKVKSTKKIDTELLGGVVVRTDNTVFDASIRTQLSKLKQSLVK